MPGGDFDLAVAKKRNVQKRVRSFHDATARFRDPEFVVLAGRTAGKCQDLPVAVAVRKQNVTAGRRHRARQQCKNHPLSPIDVEAPKGAYSFPPHPNPLPLGEREKQPRRTEVNLHHTLKGE